MRSILITLCIILVSFDGFEVTADDGKLPPAGNTLREGPSKGLLNLPPSESTLRKQHPEWFQCEIVADCRLVPTCGGGIPIAANWKHAVDVLVVDVGCGTGPTLPQCISHGEHKKYLLCINGFCELEPQMFKELANGCPTEKVMGKMIK